MTVEIEENFSSEHEFKHYADQIQEDVFSSVIQEFIDRLDVLQQEVNILKKERNFAEIVAHELRTPVSVIEANLELIQSKFNDPTIVSDAYKEVKEMALLISSLVFYDEIGENYRAHDMELVTLSECIHECVNKINSRRSEKQIKPSIHISSFEDKIMVNKRDVRFVTEALIDNAFVYGNNNSDVEVNIERAGNSVRILIKDHGVGIPVNEQQSVFTRFFRATNSSLGKNFGTGMSLYISKKIIEAHKGKIGFESRENVGTVFWFTLPRVVEGMKLQ